MERKKNILILFVILLSITLHASNKDEIYKAYINGNMNLWKTVVDKMEKENAKSNAFKLELVNYQYGYIGWCIGQGKNDAARIYLNLANNHISTLEESSYDLSSVFAYKSAFVGFEIGLNKIKAPFIGPRSISHAEMSIQLNNANPLGFVQKGNIEYYMPSVFGGSKQMAIFYYLAALKLMEKNATMMDHNWNYLDLLTKLIVAYAEKEDYKSAKYYCEKTLKKEPNFLWVKLGLYPIILKKTEK